MTLNIPVGTFQVSFVHTQINTLRLGVCSLGLTYTGADFAVDAALIENSWATHVMPNIGSTWRLTQVNWRTADGTIRSNTLSTDGGQTSAACPPQVSYLLKKSTALAGRKMRGRMYLPGVCEDKVDGNGTVSGSQLTDLNSAMNDVLSACAANDFVPVIIHNDMTPPTAISDIVPSNLVATQRRRLR